MRTNKKFKAILFGSLFFNLILATTPDGMPKELWDYKDTSNEVRYIGYDHETKLWRIELLWYQNNQCESRSGFLAERKRYVSSAQNVETFDDDEGVLYYFVETRSANLHRQLFEDLD